MQAFCFVGTDTCGRKGVGQGAGKEGDASETEPGEGESQGRLGRSVLDCLARPS